MLGNAFQDKMIMYENGQELAAAMLSATKDEEAERKRAWGGEPAPVISALFEVDPATGSGTVTLGYNKEKIRSARVLLTEVLNATARLSDGEAFPDGLGCSYLFWRSPLYSNGIGAGGLALLVKDLVLLLSRSLSPSPSLTHARTRTRRCRKRSTSSPSSTPWTWCACVSRASRI